MSDFCDFVPDDPSCQPEEVVVPEGPDGGDMGGDGHGDGHGKVDDWEDMEEMMGANPMMGNLTYLHIAMGSAIHAALDLFVWHDDTHYDAGDVLSTNYWEYTGMLSHYSHLGIFSILTVTQLLSMFGIAGEINIMAWMYMEMLEMVIKMIVQLGWMVSYDLGW